VRYMEQMVTKLRDDPGPESSGMEREWRRVGWVLREKLRKPLDIEDAELKKWGISTNPPEGHTDTFEWSDRIERYPSPDTWITSTARRFLTARERLPW